MNKPILTTVVFLLSVISIYAGDKSMSGLPEGGVADVVVEQSTSSIVVPKTIYSDGAVTEASKENRESMLKVSMVVHADAFRGCSSKREVVLTPMIVHGDSSLALSPVIVAGRTRYYQRLRADGDDAGYALLRAGSKTVYSYSVNVPRESWMDSGEILMSSRVEGCCGFSGGESSETCLAEFNFDKKTVLPVCVFVKPMGEVEKCRSVSGSAYIDFPVSCTEIIPDYRRNPEELAKIAGSIDEVSGNKDVTVKSLTIKGFASPDGPYSANEEYAKGRTESLVRYVSDRYAFPRSVLHSEWVAEDWQGFAERLRLSDITDKEAILALITNTKFEPDAREYKLRLDFPAQYPYILNEIYPALRRCDYEISYTVRNYTDLKDIEAVIRSAPQNLSLEELFVYARNFDETSSEFREVMDLAVRMFPADPVANHNAAAVAIGQGEYERARVYLTKAARLPESAYTCGVLEAMEGNFAKARPLLEQAARQGVTEASRMLEALPKL